MVNIVEFEENASPKSRGHNVESILSTPFKNDEPNERLTNLNYGTKPKAEYSRSVLANHKVYS